MRIGSAQVARAAVEYVTAVEDQREYNRKLPPGAPPDRKYALAAVRCYQELAEAVGEFQ